MTSKTNLHTLSDGRTLAYSEYGAPDGHPVFYAHGTPGSRLQGAIFHDVAAQHGFRLIAVDRPGMGQSTFLPDRTLLDYPKDIAELADTLGIESFGAMGWSGGGAHTLACSYALAERLSFAIVLCGYTTFAELSDAAKMLQSWTDRISIKLAQKSFRLFDLFYEILALTAKYLPEVHYQKSLKSINKTDRNICQIPQFKTRFLTDQQEAFVQGGKGVAQDVLIQYMDWEFRLQELSGIVHIFHGTEDRIAPLQFAEHLASHISEGKLHLLEKQGHFFPVNYQNSIFKIVSAERSSQTR